MTETAERGKYWRESDARAYLEEHATSGQSIAAFARARGIPAPRLKRWRKRLGFQSAIGMRGGQKEARPSSAATVRMARVERAAAGESSAPSAPLTIEARGVRVGVPAGFDAATV